jgi:mRNA-degrading endonuclease RelE of RelBE toxin-antitoxin system
MNYNVYTSENFDKELKRLAKKYHSIKSDIKNLSDLLKQEPLQGEPLGKDCYKVRMAITSKGKGKSGGSRVITCVKVVDLDVYMLSIFDKSDKDSISDKELDTLLKLAGLL